MLIHGSYNYHATYSRRFPMPNILLSKDYQIVWFISSSERVGISKLSEMSTSITNVVLFSFKESNRLFPDNDYTTGV